MPKQNEARPASTVVLLRDGEDGLETLLLRRNKALMFAGGFWVFPGGAIDQADIHAAKGDLQEASRLAAVREALEESGLQPRLEDMIQLSHWTTPVVEPRRFLTWIYAAPVLANDEVVIDGSEIHDSRWMDLHEATQLHDSGQMAMLPPTYITLCDLSRYHSVASFIEGEKARIPDEVFPVFGQEEERMVVMFRGDAGYASGDANQLGARHRAVLDNDCWEYVHEQEDGGHPPLIRGAL